MGCTRACAVSYALLEAIVSSRVFLEDLFLLQVRLLMCYVATHPEKLDATKQQQWQKLAALSPEDMTTITNLELLGVPVRKRGKTTGLNFGRKRKRAVRKVC